jgi:hypothetical protein
MLVGEMDHATVPPITDKSGVGYHLPSLHHCNVIDGDVRLLVDGCIVVEARTLVN